MSSGEARSMRRKTMPLSGGAGRSVTRTFCPVCSPTPEADTSALRVRCRSIARDWPILTKACAASVGLLAQKRRDIVLVDAALLQGLDRGSSVSPDHRRHRVELVVVDRAGEIVGSGLLPGHVTQHELRLRCARGRRRAKPGRHYRDAQLVLEGVVVHAAV